MSPRIDRRHLVLRSTAALLAAGGLVACSSSGSGGGTPSAGGADSPASSVSPSAAPTVTPSASTSAPSGATSGDASTGSTSSAGSADTVQVKDYAFMPATLTVATGTKVTWDFDDAADHTVSDPAAKIISDSLHQGQSFSYTFTKAGTYNYVCSIHPYMHGTVVVK